jgi:hypothetical protein
MRWRDFVKAIAVSATWPIAARAQQRERQCRVAILVGTAQDVPGENPDLHITPVRPAQLLKSFQKWADTCSHKPHTDGKKNRPRVN